MTTSAGLRRAGGAIRFTPAGDPVTRGFAMLRVRAGRLTLLDSL